MTDNTAEKTDKTEPLKEKFEIPAGSIEVEPFVYKTPEGEIKIDWENWYPPSPS
jgi:hypothetical protein